MKLTLATDKSVTEMTQEEWLAHRQQSIGSSEIAAALGVSPWKSRFQLWCEKVGECDPPDLSDREQVYWGTVLEDVVAKEFALRTNLKVARLNYILAHPEAPYLTANIDRRVVGEKAGLECKTTSSYQAKEWNDDKVPDHYYLQVQHQLAVTGWDHWYIAVLIGGQRFLWKKIERDESIIAGILTGAAEFWRMVETKEAPPADGTSACSEYLKEKFSEGTPTVVAIEQVEGSYWINQYNRGKEMENEGKEIKDTAQNRLCQILGSHELGLCGDTAVEWKTVKSNRIDTDRLKKERPDVYRQYQKESASRRFGIK